MVYPRRAFLASSSVALAGLLATRAAAQSTAPIRIGSTTNDSYAEPFYAHEQGFFEKAGLDVEVFPFPNGGAVTSAVAGNAVDIGITNPISLANAVEHGLPFLFFAAAGMYNPDEVVLCVAADSPIKSAQELDGKTLATTALRGSNSLEISAWIDHMGGDSTKVQFVEMPMITMAAAISRGTVAAAEIAEPALSMAKNAGTVRVIGHPLDVYGRQFMVGGWFARADYLAAHAATVRRLIGVIYETARWANAHRSETAAILAKYSKIDLGLARSMNRAIYATSFGPQMFQSYLDLGYKYKYIGRHFDGTKLVAKLT